MGKVRANPVGYQVSRAQRFAKRLRDKQRHKRNWNREHMARRSRNLNLGARGQRRKRSR
jgi:hypothetical protein